MNESLLAAVAISVGSKELMHAPGPWDLKSASILLQDRNQHEIQLDGPKQDVDFSQASISSFIDRK